MNANLLTQMTDKPTRYDNLLDPTLTTNSDLIMDLKTHPGINDHSAITYNMNLTVKESQLIEKHGRQKI